jgi:hypothetical protein
MGEFARFGIENVRFYQFKFSSIHNHLNGRASKKGEWRTNDDKVVGIIAKDN